MIFNAKVVKVRIVELNLETSDDFTDFAWILTDYGHKIILHESFTEAAERNFWDLPKDVLLDFYLNEDRPRPILNKVSTPEEVFNIFTDKNIVGNFFHNPNVPLEFPGPKDGHFHFIYKKTPRTSFTFDSKYGWWEKSDIWLRQGEKQLLVGGLDTIANLAKFISMLNNGSIDYIFQRVANNKKWRHNFFSSLKQGVFKDE